MNHVTNWSIHELLHDNMHKNIHKHISDIRRDAADEPGMRLLGRTHHYQLIMNATSELHQAVQLAQECCNPGGARVPFVIFAGKLTSVKPVAGQTGRIMAVFTAGLWVWHEVSHAWILLSFVKWHLVVCYTYVLSKIPQHTNLQPISHEYLWYSVRKYKGEFCECVSHSLQSFR